MSTPEPDEDPLDGMSRIRAVIDSMPRISTSRNRYLEKDLEVIFHDRFLVHAIARDPHAARQIHEATGVPLPALYKWRDHLEVAATWRPWNHKVNHGSQRRKLNDIEGKMIDEALNGRSARGGRSIGSWCRLSCGRSRSGHAGSGLTCVCHPSGCLTHRLCFTPRGCPCPAPPRGGPACGGCIPGRRG
jgi:hypothetical protein